MVTIAADRPRRIPARIAGVVSSRGYPAALSALGLALLVFALTPFVLGAIDAARAHEVFLGAVGNYPQDVLQYLAWLRSAHDGLIRNLYGSAGLPVFIHPMWSPSGWLQALTGVSDAAVIGFWTVVGTVTLFAGCAALGARHIASHQPARRIAAVAITVAGGLTPVGWLLEGHDPGLYARAIGDLIPLGTVWEYAPLAITIGLMAFALPRIERIVDGSERRRASVALTVAMATLITWLHPWQGETMIAITVGLVAWRRLDGLAGDAMRATLVRTAPVILAAALPAAYYLLLSRIDAGWAQSERGSQANQIPLEVFTEVVLPLLLVWLLAAWRLRAEVTVRGLLLWPPATVLTVLATPTGQYRAVDGLIVPVAILAVKAWPTLRARSAVRLAVGAVLAGLALAPTYQDVARLLARPAQLYHTPFGPLLRDDVRAATYAGRFAGGHPVITSDTLGVALPALTGQPSWIGHVVWTPDLEARTATSTALLTDTLAPSAVRQLVRTTGTRAVVAPCAIHRPRLAALEVLGFRARRFGCATAYVLPAGRARV